MAFAGSSSTPLTPRSLLEASRKKDLNWMHQVCLTQPTSHWRLYYAMECAKAGYPQASSHLFLTRPFDPRSKKQSSDALKSIRQQEASSDEFEKVMVYTLSYDHDENGEISNMTWDRVLDMLRSLSKNGVRYQLWVDKVDSKNRTCEWGMAQLLPYVLFPVIRVGTPGREAGFWSNMEGLAGIFGKGLIHDSSLDEKVIQYSCPIETVTVDLPDERIKKKKIEFLYSKAGTFNCQDAIACFIVHLSYGFLSKYRNHHQQALQVLRRECPELTALHCSDLGAIEILLRYERNQVGASGRFEILNGFQCRTDIPWWTGYKEWITLDRFVHINCSDHLEKPLTIDGFVNTYYNDAEKNQKTISIVHWEFPCSRWTRRLRVIMYEGSREQGRAKAHTRLPGYRQDYKEEILENERDLYKSMELPNVYTFDSKLIQWT